MISQKHWLVRAAVALLALSGTTATAQNSLTAGYDAPVDRSAPGDWQEEEKPEKVKANGPSLNAATPVTRDEDFIIFGYIQNEQALDGIRWHAITDVGTTFIEFDTNGDIINPTAFLNRDADIRAGGVAEAAGVGVHMVILNDGFDVSIINDVLPNATKRANLIQEIVDLINQDAVTNGSRYVHGVSFDFEPFSWNASASAGMIDFFTDLRTALDGIDPSLEISFYVDPTPNATQFSTMPSYVDQLDYVFYSMYDFGTGTTPRAVSDFDSSLSFQRAYMETYGVPPEKFVPLPSTYSRYWDNTTGYGVATSPTTSSSTGLGFTDALFNTTLRPSPFTPTYEQGDETSWYLDGTRVVVNPLVEGLEYKIRQPLSYNDPASIFNGRKLGGVGYWSLWWLMENSSYDLIAASTGSFYRTYPHVYEINQLALSPPGQQRFLIEGFEGFNARWEDPNTSPDTVGDTDSDSFRLVEAAPGGSGAPASTTNAIRVAMEFEQATGNQVFFRHEILGHETFTSVPDWNAPSGFVDPFSEIQAYVHAGTSGSPTALPSVQVAIVVMDNQGELERGPFFTLSTAGWQTITMDLTGSVTGVATSEPAFNSGDGIIDTAGDERDVAFTGFLITDSSGLSGAKSIWFDEVSWTRKSPVGDYVINEFRYDGTQEFVEIYGPAGPLPSTLRLRTYDATGTVVNEYDLNGSIVDEGSGFGFFVLGDVAVANVDDTEGGTGIALPDSDPSAIQLVHSSGAVLDSVVYEAHGGLDNLIRVQTRGVTDEGFPWLGRFASGTDSSGQAATAARYPDGNDTDFNYADFSTMKATPGASNGGAVTMPFTTDFSSAPASVVSTFQSVKIENPVTAGIAANDGNALRVIDTTGGGVMTYVGDKALGAAGPYSITGKVYLPETTANAQAIGLGIGVSQGTTFFSSVTANSAYENGYWLIWENRSGVGLSDGQADHPNQWNFVHASHDNMDGEITALLGSNDDASLGITPGTWVDFRLVINTSEPAGQQLLAQINGRDVFRGSIPAGGPTSGAFAAGFRENHAGSPTADEGTWIDDLTITNAAAAVDISAIPLPVELDAFMVE